MKMMKRIIVALALAMGLIGNQAVATMLTTSNVAIPIGQNVTLYNIDPSAPVSTIAGQMVFTLDAASTALNGGVDTIDAWCIDLFHVIYLGANAYQFTEGTFIGGTTTDNATPTPHTLTTATLDKMAGLMELGNGVLQFGGLSGANAHYGIVGGTLEDWSAAVQLAIWDTEYLPNYPALIWGGGGPPPIPWPYTMPLLPMHPNRQCIGFDSGGWSTEFRLYDRQDQFAGHAASRTWLAGPSRRSPRRVRLASAPRQKRVGFGDIEF